MHAFAGHKAFSNAVLSYFAVSERERIKLPFDLEVWDEIWSKKS